MANGITLKDVYEVVNRLESKFDERYERLDSRVSKLETFQNKALGILSVVVMFTSLAASYIWNRLIKS